MNLPKQVNQAPIQRIALNQIAVGLRLRERVGSVVDLKKSIEDLGLMHPILVTDQADLTKAHGRKYLLIAGERRKRAFELLDEKSVPARVMRVGVETLMRMEEDENTQRADLDAYALSKPRWDEVQSEYDRLIAEYRQGLGEKGPRARPVGESTQQKMLGEARKRVGVPRQTAQRDEKIVRAVKKYPELERWSQRPMLRACEALDAVDPSERKLLRSFAAMWESRSCKEAAEAIENLVDRWPANLRKKIYRTMKKDPEHAQSAALGVPPVPDQRLARVGLVRDDLKQILSEFRRRDEAQVALGHAMKHLDSAYEFLRYAYEEKREEFEQMIVEV